jgi:hypothetical protein
VRLAIADPDLIRGGPAGTACRAAARRLIPAASSRLVAEATAWLESWPETALLAELSRARKARRPIEAGVGWTVAVPREGHPPCVVRGRFDLIYRDSAGRWRPVIVGTRIEASSDDLLRLALADVAATRLGKTPGGPPWWVHGGPDGLLSTEPVMPATPAALEDALSRWVEQRRTRDGVTDR